MPWIPYKTIGYVDIAGHAVMIEFELSSIWFLNLYTDLRKSSAKEGIPLETNMLLALYGLEIQRSRQSTLLYGMVW